MTAISYDDVEELEETIAALRAELAAANKAVEEYTRPLELDDLVAVAHWSDFDTADAVQVGRFSHFRDGHYYILESGRGWRYCRRVLPLTAHPEEQE